MGTVERMTPHTHHHRSCHAQSATFDDGAVADMLEAEGELATGLAEQAATRCTDLMDGAAGRARRIADLGCGPGVATSALARIFPSANVIGVDDSPVMLARTAARAAREGKFDRVEVRRLDLNQDLGVLGTFDLAWAALSLHHAQDESAVLESFRKLLRPHGLLCLLERAEPMVVRPTHDLGRHGIWERVEAVQSAWSERARGSLPGAANAATYAGMIEYADLELLEAGTLSDSVKRPVDAGLRALIHRYVQVALRNVHDVLPPTDVEALTLAVGRVTDVAWGDALVTSTRTLFIARPATSNE